MFRPSKYLLVSALIISVLLNIILGYFYLNNNSSSNDKESFDELQQKYPLLSKRILQEFPQDILINFLDLRNELRKQVEPYGDSFGFYFEYLPTGTSIGVNDKRSFHAASLFKVPVIMAYYHQKERLQINDDPQLKLKEEDIDKEFGDLWKKGAGYQIKTSEAIRLALEESDNTAAKLIASNVQEEDFAPVYEGVDLDLQTDKGGAILSPKNYTSILKALYFSAVLKKDSSQEILDMLSKTKFNNKLAAGIPSGVTVSHKIGDFIDKETNERAYMDCGIVYLPRRPYVLCMVSETDENTASERMKMLSQTIYNYVSSTE